MSVSRSEVRAIADLARLAVPDSALDGLAHELSAVLKLFDDLAAAPVDGLAPLAHPGDPSLRLRDDVVSEVDQREAFEAIAPAASAGYYLVPKVIE